jgi:ferrous iron transport protein B
MEVFLRIFTLIGFGNWQSAVAAITGLIAKENVFSTFSVMFAGLEEVTEDGWKIWDNIRMVFTPLAAYSFMVFNLLCAPCFAAIGAIRREMNNAGWTWFAVGYQCGVAYMVSFMVYQFGLLFTGNGTILGSFAAFAALTGLFILLLKPKRAKVIS